jgi:hypothetical protein
MLEHRTSRTPPSAPDCCVDPPCETGLRNNYFPGKHLTPDALRTEQTYLVERRRLLNRAIHGWGVVYGFPVTVAHPAAAGRLLVGAGLALDRAGRELVHVEPRDIGLDDVIVVDEHGARVATECRETAPPWRAGCWLLSAHYGEQHVGPVTTRDACGCDRHQWDRTCETVRFSLRWIDCDDCCPPATCQLCCECGSGPCCEQHRREHRHRQGHPVARGGGRCLCDHLTQLRPDVECKRLETIAEPCGRVDVDLHNGVPLACVRIVREECEPWKFGEWIEACGPRRLVKRNDVLFDLVQGCDLTRILEIGWHRWHRREDPIPFDEFSEAFGEAAHGRREYETAFWVSFSRPVRTATLRPDCFAITVLSADQDAWWSVRRVPIVRVDTTVVPPEPGDPPEHARGARIVVDGACVEERIRGRKCVFVDGESWIEIEIRGDLILDCNGQAVDANAVGASPFPTGNGTPGGTFVSSFCVAPRESTGRGSYGSAARSEGEQR